MDLNQFSPSLQQYLQAHPKNDPIKIQIEKDTLLSFDSLVESGNIDRVYYSEPNQYKLVIRGETNPGKASHYQWFFTHIYGFKPAVEYSFTILPFTKPLSFFNKGQRIWARNLKGKWQQIGSQCYDQQFSYLSPQSPEDQSPPSAQNSFFKLQFKLKFSLCSHPISLSPENCDNCDLIDAIAFCKPITYTSMISQVIKQEQILLQSLNQTSSEDKDQIENNKQESKGKATRRIISQERKICYERNVMGYSNSGLPIYYLKISDFKQKSKQQRQKYVIITSRVHSGETHTSIVFNRVLERLMSDDSLALALRKEYTFILVPCLNPEGVVFGNYRVNLSGFDLNRQWDFPKLELHPEIFAFKEFLNKIHDFSKEGTLVSPISIFCDMHCHSRKLNSFFYGCNTASRGGITSWTKTRLLPRIMAKQSQALSIKQCCFKVQANKYGTGRVVMWDQYGVTNSFTFENSFFGFRNSDSQVSPYSESDYFNLGEQLLNSIYEFNRIEKFLEKELAITKGWLKPHKLNELTGMSAAERAQVELIQQKQKEQRQRSIEEYQQIMRNEEYYDKMKAQDSSRQTLKKAGYRHISMKVDPSLLIREMNYESDSESEKDQVVLTNMKAKMKSMSLVGGGNRMSNGSIRGNQEEEKTDDKIKRDKIGSPFPQMQISVKTSRFDSLKNQKHSEIISPPKQIQSDRDEANCITQRLPEEELLDEFIPHHKESSDIDDLFIEAPLKKIIVIKKEKQRLEQNEEGKEKQEEERKDSDNMYSSEEELQDYQDWREYFTQEEIEIAITKISKGEDPNSARENEEEEEEEETFFAKKVRVVIKSDRKIETRKNKSQQIGNRNMNRQPAMTSKNDALFRQNQHFSSLLKSQEQVNSPIKADTPYYSSGQQNINQKFPRKQLNMQKSKEKKLTTNQSFSNTSNQGVNISSQRENTSGVNLEKDESYSIINSLSIFKDPKSQQSGLNLGNQLLNFKVQVKRVGYQADSGLKGAKNKEINNVSQDNQADSSKIKVGGQQLSGSQQVQGRAGGRQSFIQDIQMQRQKIFNHNQAGFQGMFNSGTNQNFTLHGQRGGSSPQQLSQLQAAYMLHSHKDSILQSIEVKSISKNLQQSPEPKPSFFKQNRGKPMREVIEEELQQSNTLYTKEQYPIFPIMNQHKRQTSMVQEKSKERVEPKQVNIAFCNMFFKHHSPNNSNMQQKNQNRSFLGSSGGGSIEGRQEGSYNMHQSAKGESNFTQLIAGSTSGNMSRYRKQGRFQRMQSNQLAQKVKYQQSQISEEQRLNKNSCNSEYQSRHISFKASSRLNETSIELSEASKLVLLPTKFALKNLTDKTQINNEIHSIEIEQFSNTDYLDQSIINHSIANSPEKNQTLTSLKFDFPIQKYEHTIERGKQPEQNSPDQKLYDEDEQSEDEEIKEQIKDIFLSMRKTRQNGQVKVGSNAGFSKRVNGKQQKHRSVGAHDNGYYEYQNRIA